ncbi:MAG: class I SAM-dependent methyltransferase [Elusimicrobia bacterium]|nr:class I SAM-dependent methyltransferase [Elusimicrobiota bacterium]
MTHEPHIPPAHFHIFTPCYDVLNEVLGLGRSFRRVVIETLALKGNECVLDAGCGTGSLLADLLATHPNIRLSGADPDTAALAIARRKLQGDIERVKVIKAPMDRLPFADASFDVVVSTLTFHHIPVERKSASLAECRRLLRPGGRILLADFGPDRARFFSRVALGFLNIFESISDNTRLPNLLAEAGFAQIRLVGRVHLTVMHTGLRGETRPT